MNWLGVSEWLALLLCLMAVAAWLVPLGSARRVAGWRAALLMVLRAGWLAVALILALGLRWPVPSDSRPVVVAVHAKGGATVPAHWRDAFRWQHMRLAGGSAVELGGRGRPALAGPLDLGAALEEWAVAGYLPAAFVLLGDADPVGLERSPAPLFVLRERPPDADRQLRMVGLESPRNVVPGLPFKMSASFRGGSDCEGEDWSVRLLGPAGEEDVRSVLCEPATTRTIELRSMPTSSGIWDYRLEWQAPGQAARSAVVATEVTAEPMAVLFLEASPGWEVNFLRRSVKNLVGLQTHTLTRLSARHVQRGPDLSIPAEGFGLADLSQERFRLLVLRQPDLTDADADWVRRFVARRGGALILLGAAPEGLAFLAPLPEGEGTSLPAGPVTATLSGRSHPILSEFSARLPLQPALQLEFSPALERPLATRVLARVDTRPWMAVRRFGAGRVMQVVGPETYRWKLRGGSSALVYDAMWREAMQWLVEPAGARQTIRTVVRAAAPGSRVALRVDWRREPLRQESTAVRLRTGPALLPVPFRPGSFRGWVNMDQSRQQVALHGDSGERDWVAVAGAAGTFGNQEALSEVASRSGGRILYSDEPPPEIERGAGSVSSVEWKPARESFWPPVILLALAAAEWGARRRWGCEE